MNSRYSDLDGFIGDWIGGFETQHKYEPIKAHFYIKDNKIEAKFEIPMRNLTEQHLDDISLSPTQVHFKLQINSETIVFNGRLKNKVIEGNFKQGEIVGSFHLIKIANIDQKIYEK